MKKSILSIAAIIFCIGIYSSVYAGYTNSGTLLGVFTDNDNDLETVYHNIIDSPYYTGGLFYLTDFEFYAKGDLDDTDGTTTYEGEGALYLTYESDFKSGTWQTFKAPDTEGPALSFYSVKGSDEYAIYWVDPADDEGTWSTMDLNNGGGNIPAISHFSAWNPISEPGAGVPEPATLILVGFGLLGLAGIGRQTRKK